MSQISCIEAPKRLRTDVRSNRASRPAVLRWMLSSLYVGAHRVPRPSGLGLGTRRIVKNGLGGGKPPLPQHPLGPGGLRPQLPFRGVRLLSAPPPAVRPAGRGPSTKFDCSNSMLCSSNLTLCLRLAEKNKKEETIILIAQ